MTKDNVGHVKFHLIAIFFISILCIIIYANTIHSPFIFDDLPHIKENPYCRMTHLDFRRLYDAGFNSPNPTRPLANISFALNYYFGGYDVSGYHIVNIMIHLINGILIYLLSLNILKHSSVASSQKIFPSTPIAVPFMAWCVALIFVAHPIQTQSVTYIDQRMNSMSAMFYLLSLLLYIYGRLTAIKWKQWILFCCSLTFWIMALGSKEIAATLPLIVLLYEWYFFQDLGLDWLKRNMPYFLGLFVILGLTVLIYTVKVPIDTISDYYAIRDFTLSERVLTQFRVVVLYISLLFWPHPSRLNLLHHITTSKTMFIPITTFLSLLALIGLVGLAIYLAKKNRLISFCIFWFLINLAVESSVIGLEMIYEYRLYLPLFGFSLLVTYLLFSVLWKRPIWLAVFFITIILSLCMGTYKRNNVWRNSLTLWTDVVSKNPQSHRAHNNLGVALMEQGRLEQAIEHYKQALKIMPGYYYAHFNLGNALDKQGYTEKAIDYYSMALRIKPDFAKAHYNMGNAFNKLNHFEAAIEHYKQALQAKPDYAKAHYNLGVSLDKQGRIQAAIKHYLQVLQLEPDNAEAYNNLGMALDRQGHTEEAVKHYQQALRIKPDFVDALYNLGFILDRQDRSKEAVDHYMQVLRIQPNHAQAHNNIGVVLDKQGHLLEAIDHYQTALTLKPNFAQAHFNLGNALKKKGHPEAAIDHFLKALEINPDYAEAHNNLGVSLFQKRDITGAIAHFKEAVRIKPDYTNAKDNLNRLLILQQQRQ